MRIIKLGIISIVFFSLLITGISLFIPSHIRISRAIDINANKDSVLHQLDDVANWKTWYPGAGTAKPYIEDGVMKGIITGNQQALVISSVTDSAVFTSNTGPAAGRSDSGWNIYGSSVPGRVTVQWFMDFHFRWYPWEKFSGLMFEARYGPSMERGLAKLKLVLEK